LRKNHASTKPRAFAAMQLLICGDPLGSLFDGCGSILPKLGEK
jgi:hypothetical protein